MQVVKKEKKKKNSMKIGALTALSFYFAICGLQD